MKLREEPFRLFFPLAMLAMLMGVVLWPILHHFGLPYYPGMIHARVMSAGLAGFLLGFLGTALPRLLAAPSLKGGELALVLGLWMASVVLPLFNRVPSGDACLAAALLLLALSLAARWLLFAKDTPPPGMPVALVGLLCGGISAAALAWKRGAWMDPSEFRLAHLFLYQGMALLCLLGVGPYLFPRLFGSESAHSFETSARPPTGWWPRFLVAISLGLVVYASLVLEAYGNLAWGSGIRAAAVLAWILWETPLLRRAAALTTCGTTARVASLSIVVALGWAALDPSRRVGILHFYFVSGLGLVMMGIGVRVVLGHAGRHDLLADRIVWLRVVMVLALLAVATRVTADFVPKIRISHLDYAAATWGIITILWLWKLRRSFFTREPGEDSRKCPKARERSMHPSSSPLREEKP